MELIFYKNKNRLITLFLKHLNSYKINKNSFYLQKKKYIYIYMCISISKNYKYKSVKLDFIDFIDYQNIRIIFTTVLLENV